MNMQLGSNAKEQKSNLSKTAKEVFPEMGAFYEKAREFIANIGKTEVHISNEVVGLGMQIDKIEAAGGEVPDEIFKEYQTKAIDFRINLQQIKSSILADADLTDRQKRIRGNYVHMIERVVLASSSGESRQLEEDHA